RREIGPGSREIDAVGLAELPQRRALPGRGGAAPGPDGALRQAEPGIRDHLVQIDAEHAPEAAAVGAGPQGRLVGEQPGARRLQTPAALRTGEPLPEAQDLALAGRGSAVHADGTRPPKADLHRVRDPASIAGRHLEE